MPVEDFKKSITWLSKKHETSFNHHTPLLDMMEEPTWRKCREPVLDGIEAALCAQRNILRRSASFIVLPLLALAALGR